MATVTAFRNAETTSKKSFAALQRMVWFSFACLSLVLLYLHVSLSFSRNAFLKPSVYIAKFGAASKDQEPVLTDANSAIGINEKTMNTDLINAEGYLPTDFNSVSDGKKTRVLLYIALALIPCLALVPFFLSREFVPPVDTDYNTAIEVSSTK